MNLKPLSLTEKTASIRERPRAGWAKTAATTLHAAAVCEPTLLFVTEGRERVAEKKRRINRVFSIIAFPSYQKDNGPLKVINIIGR